MSAKPCQNTVTHSRLSGRQFVLRHGGQQVVVTEVGGGLRGYTVDGRPVLDGYGEHEMCPAGHGQVLIPWPNRIEAGRYRFGGTDHTLAATEPEAGNAIHGLTRWANWTPVSHDEQRLRLGHTLHAQPGYPFVLGCELVYTLDDDGLRVRTSVTNLGGQPCPYATGAHPYLTVGTPRIDRARLRLPARTRYRTDARGIPTGREPAEEFDDLIGPRRLDTAFTGLVRDDDGLVRVRLSGHHAAVTLWADQAYGWLQVFTGDTLEPARRRTGLAVEPMTAAPNAFRTGDGLLTLQAGQRHDAEWGLYPTG